MHFDLRLPAIALVVCCMATTGEALTVYRLGGADVPEPDLEGAAFDFVQLYWEDVDDNRFGDSISLDLQPGSIAPEVMDSNVNLAPSTSDENFLYLGGSGRSLRVQDPRIAGCRFVWSTRTTDSYYTDDTGLSFMFDLQRQVHLRAHTLLHPP